jgi:hypothetical protein
VIAAAGHIFQRFNFPEYNLGLFDQAQSRLCEADFPGGALQQLQAQFVFSLRNWALNVGWLTLHASAAR